MYRGAYFGEGVGPIFLDKLACSGTESRLLDCDTRTPHGVHSCDHSQDAGVRCIGMQQQPLMMQTLEHVLFIRWYITDSNECVNDNGGCEHMCINLIPGYHCSCFSGYLLNSDGRSCNGKFMGVAVAYDNANLCIFAINLNCEFVLSTEISTHAYHLS